MNLNRGVWSRLYGMSLKTSISDLSIATINACFNLFKNSFVDIS